MKQLLIVNSTKALNAKAVSDEPDVTPFDLRNLAKGAITFFELGGTEALTEAPKKNFGIALGRGENIPVFVIPEVDIDTLEVVKTLPDVGRKFKVEFTMPTTVVGEEYGFILIKKGVVPHERNLFSTSIVAKSTDNVESATALVKAIENKKNDLFNVTASNNGINNNPAAKVTIEANDDSDYEIKFVDGLANFNNEKKVTTTGPEGDKVTTGYTMGSNDKLVTVTTYKKAIGDKAYILDLAQRCAADKGFNYLDQESLDIYPGYPEEVEDIAGGNGYAIFNLHFATGRKAGKQVDERVWQYVHIAVPKNGSAYADIDTILSGAKPNDQAVKDA